MLRLIILFLFFTPFKSAQQNLKGKVIDSETLNPLPNSNIIIEGTSIGTISNVNGDFTLTGNFSNSQTLQISFVGYYTQRISLKNVNFSKNLLIKLEQKIIPAQTVLVEGSIGKEGVTPLAFSKITQKEIEKNYTIQDVPKYLSSLPSTTFYSENGNGIGYNYLNIRGFDQRRISVSVNGIPQNDPEDQNVYWLDFPDLLASTAVIQVQRGAGSGVIGYPAIGGSINIITSTFSNHPLVNFSASTGSYNTRKYSADVSSGLIDNKYSVYAKLSQILSSGYRNNSWVKFNAYYLSAVRFDDNLTTQINLYGGPIADGLAYYGLPKFAIKNESLRKANYSYWEANNSGYTYTILRRPTEIENFSQPHFELLNQLKINENVTLNSALFLVTGNGFFNYDGTGLDTTALHLTSQYGFHPVMNPSNILIKAEVDNTQLGWIPRLSYKHNHGELIVGAEFRFHKSTHWGSVDYASNLPEGLSQNYRVYYFNGGMNIINGFVHESYTPNNKWNFLGEIQLAYHKYRFYNERFYNNDFFVAGLYFNPRIGVNYKLNPVQNFYFSYARVTREPTLSTYYSGEDAIWGSTPQFKQNNNGTYDFSQPYVNPETMNDFEFGSSFIKNNFNITLNLYYMLFNNEIVNNGKLDIFGQPITGNMKSTEHEGVELSSKLNFNKSLQIYANATFSHNQIITGEYFINSTDAIDLSGNIIGGFPSFLANFGINASIDNFFIQMTGRYVGNFYSDNYGNNLNQYLKLYPGFVDYTDNQNDAYFSADFFASYSLKEFSALVPSKIYVQVNNIFNNLYSANAIGSQFYPAADRNFLVGIQLGL